MPCNLLAYPVLSCHIMSCHAMKLSISVMSCHHLSLTCQVMSFTFISCYALSCHSLSSLVRYLSPLTPVLSCCLMSCRHMSCHLPVMPCNVSMCRPHPSRAYSMMGKAQRHRTECAASGLEHDSSKKKESTVDFHGHPRDNNMTAQTMNRDGRADSEQEKGSSSPYKSRIRTTDAHDLFTHVYLVWRSRPRPIRWQSQQ